MTKWKCNKIGCYCCCEIDIASSYCPVKCVGFEGRSVEWRLMQKEPEQKQEETTLPDWCKVGEWVWNKPAEEYVKITDISNGLITGKGVCDKIYYTEWHLSYYCEARLRPYNAEEMKALVGKVLEHDGNASLVIVYLGNGLLRVGTKWVSAERLIEEGYTIDGKPCGKLKHLEDGGWVE